MIKLTLPDGTRTQIDANEITDVEPDEGGALLHLKSGDKVQVLQDARILEARLKIAWGGAR